MDYALLGNGHFTEGCLHLDVYEKPAFLSLSFVFWSFLIKKKKDATDFVLSFLFCIRMEIKLKIVRCGKG